jgi:hypothetical protein
VLGVCNHCSAHNIDVAAPAGQAFVDYSLGRCEWDVSKASAQRVRLCARPAVVKMTYKAYCLEHFQAALRETRQAVDGALRLLGATHP